MEKEIGNIAIIEFKSIARGIEVTDGVVKSAQVNLLISAPLCPGKYLTVVEGELDALGTGVEVAEQQGGRHVYSTEIIGGIDARVIGAISGQLSSTAVGAVGIVESLQMAFLINAADICVDTAEVEFMDFRLARGCGVNSFFVITGQLAAIQEAVRQASDYLSGKGSLIAQKVIANPDRQVLRWLTSAMCRC